MQCFVYRSTRHADTYVFVPRADDFEELPADLREHLGSLEFAMEIDLTPDRSLARTDGQQVMDHFAERGYYLQLPDRWKPLS